MYVYVIGQNLGYWAIRTAETQPDPKEILTVTPDWSMDRICRRVCEIAEDGISILFLVAHGETHNAPSRIALGQGLTVGTANRFNLLRNYWIGEYPRIEVHACYTASETPPNCIDLPDSGFRGILRRARDPRTGRINYSRRQIPRRQICTPGTPGPTAPGHAIMQTLANAAGVLVIAPVNAQFIDWNFSFEGSVRHYRPAQYFLRRG